MVMPPPTWRAAVKGDGAGPGCVCPVTMVAAVVKAAGEPPVVAVVPAGDGPPQPPPPT
jgi:hypothetical protein